MYAKSYESQRTRTEKSIIEILLLCPTKKSGYCPHRRNSPHLRYIGIAGTRSVSPPVRFGLDFEIETGPIPCSPSHTGWRKIQSGDSPDPSETHGGGERQLSDLRADPPREPSTERGELLLMAEPIFPYPHKTDPDIFRESVSYSEGLTGFTASLIEKDYYCLLILHHLFDRETTLVFKGGTCFVRVYADFDGFNMDEAFELIAGVAKAVFG